MRGAMTIRWAYLKRFLAGAIFGLYMAHLLYFLNPQVDITPGRLATVTIFYGVGCGILFGTALWGLRALRVRLFGRAPLTASGASRAHGFGFVVLAAFLASIIYWVHLDPVRIYLPIGAVRNLSKATNLITATAFALLLLWVIERSVDRVTSRAIFVAGVSLIAISSFFLYERRDSYRTEKQTVVVANIGTVAGQRPVIVVAIRNLPFDWIVTMAGEGLLPFFTQARDRAWLTRLEPFPTTSTKALWASLATGKLPYRHGVTGRFSYRTPVNGADPTDRFLLLPSGVGFAAWGLIPPVKRISAQLPSGDSLPLWTLFERLSFRASVVNWPEAKAGASRIVPSRAIETLGRAQLAQLGDVAPRFNGAGTAQPRIINGLAGDFATIEQLRAVILLPTGEGARRADEGPGESAAPLTRRSAPPSPGGRGIADRFELNVAALEGFGEAQRAVHIITNELPPRSTVKGEVLRAYCDQLDRMLAALARDHPDHLLVIVSPSGPITPHVRATAWSFLKAQFDSDEAGDADGFMLMTGPGVEHRSNPATAYATDIVPTLLYAAGLPVGRDMDGRVLSDAFSEELLRRNTLSVIQTYEATQVVVRKSGR
jgi:hypothetical protein